MLNKPDWFILRMTSFCSAETSHLVHLEVNFLTNVAKKTSDALGKKYFFLDVSWFMTLYYLGIPWYINKLIIEKTLYHLIPALYYASNHIIFLQFSVFFFCFFFLQFIFRKTCSSASNQGV